MILPVLVWAAAEGAGTGGVNTDVVSVFLQYGALGALALVLLLFARGAYKRETERADRAEARLDELHRDMRDKVVPVLTEATRSMADVAVMLRERERR